MLTAYEQLASTVPFQISLGRAPPVVDYVQCMANSIGAAGTSLSPHTQSLFTFRFHCMAPSEWMEISQQAIENAKNVQSKNK